MKNGSFVLDAHTGFWDASKENCKNRFGDAFIETFYAFHNGFNPPEKHWTMDYEKQFRRLTQTGISRRSLSKATPICLSSLPRC